MINTSAAGIESSMDELIGEVDLNYEIDEEDFEENYDEDIVIIQEVPLDLELDENGDEILPTAVNQYVDSLEAQTRQLEQELLECDALMNHSFLPKAGQMDAVVVYDDQRELETLAAEQGITVEEYKQKLLNDLEEYSFTEEDVDKEYEEFLQLQEELAQIRDDTSEIFKARELTKQPDSILAIEAPIDNIESSMKNTEKSDDIYQHDNSASSHRECDTNTHEASALVPVSTLSNMREFIHEQLKHGEQLYQTRKQKLKENIEAVRLREERQLLQHEEMKKDFQKRLIEDERSIQIKKEEMNRKTEEEIKEIDDAIITDLNLQQTEIERCSEILEGERQQFANFRREVDAMEEKKKKEAATVIQRLYRGFRSRRANATILKELEEMLKLKKKERYDIRVMELEYEIKYKKEEAERLKKEEEKALRDQQLREQ